MSDFRKKIFRGAKIEDLILDLERMEKEFQETMLTIPDPERKRFYEGMAVAFKLVAMKLKGEFEYLEVDVLEKVYESFRALDQTDLMTGSKTKIANRGKCSFCLQQKEPLVLGPLVSICADCVQFAGEVLNANQNKTP